MLDLKLIYNMKLQTIKQTIDTFYDIDISEKNRTQLFVEAKQMYCYFSRMFTYFSYDVIGKEIGIHHTTAIHNENKAKDYIEIDKDFRLRNHKIRNILESNLTSETITKDINYIKLYEDLLNENRNLNAQLNRLQTKYKQLVELNVY